MQKISKDVKKAILRYHRKYKILRTQIVKFSNKVSAFIIEKRDILIKVALPIFVILVGYHACTFSQKAINHGIREIFEISDTIRYYYADKPDYWGLSTELVVQNNILPSNYIKQNKLVLSGGNEILIGTGLEGDVVMPRSKTFDIIMLNLNKAQCISFVTSSLPEDSQIKLSKITVYNSGGEHIFEWSNGMLPIKSLENGICIKGNNTLIWTIQ